MSNYWQRVTVGLRGWPLPSLTRAGDPFRAWDRLSRTTYATLPRQLDRTRRFRNRFLDAVR